MTAHKHAAILAQAAEDAKTDPKFYEKWEFKIPHSDAWHKCQESTSPGMFSDWDYRRKPAKPRECLAVWHDDYENDPWGGAWPIHSKRIENRLHMIEVTPEVRAALAAAGIEVSQRC